MTFGKLIALILLFIFIAVLSFFGLYYIAFKWIFLLLFNRNYDLYGQSENSVSAWESLIMGWHLAAALGISGWLVNKSFKDELKD